MPMQKRNREGESQRLARREAEEQAGQPRSDLPVVAAPALADARLSHPANVARRAVLIRSAQRSLGNRALQRAVRSQPAPAAPGGLLEEVSRDIEEQRGAGFPLEAAMQAAWAPLLGYDLSGVRVHTDPAANRLAGRVAALAFASGPDIFFGAGAYRPASAEGQRLLAHEVAHVVQQAGQAPRGGPLTVSSPGDALEREAAAVGDAVVAGLAVDRVTHSGTGGLQRQPAPAEPTRSSPDMPEDKDARWTEAGGDTLIAAVEGDLAQWATWRRSPMSYKDMPGSSATAAINAFLHNRPAGIPLEPWMKFHASSKLGSQNLAYLREMASLCFGFASDVGLIFNVSRADPAHEYTIKSHNAVGLAEGAIQSFAPTLEMTYRNALGMTWARNFTVPGLNFSLGLSKEVSPVDVEINPEKPNVIQPSVEQGVELTKKGVVSVEPLQIDIEGEAKAKPSAYCGPEDLGGIVTVMTGPAAEMQLGNGAKVQTGSAVRFSGGPLPLDFENFGVRASWTNKVAPKVKFSMIGIGLGAAIGGETRVGAAPEYEQPVVRDVRQWSETIFYETGEYIPPDSTPDKLVALKRQVLDALSQLRIEEDAAILSEKGIDLGRALELQVQILGWASRAWEGAPTQGQRKAENQALATERAMLMKRLVESLFQGYPGNMTIAALGRGAGTLGPTEGNEAPEMITDPEAQKVYEDRKAETNRTAEEKKKEAMRETDPAARARLLASIERDRQQELRMWEHLYGPRSNLPQARRVEIRIVWAGHRVAHELPAIPKSPAASAPPAATS